jgi:CheY-like chemotaxis protein
MAQGALLGGGETILIVDDDIAYCDAMAEILASAGFRTLKANSVATAVSILAGATPDMILSDSMMPVADGGILLRIIRSDPGLRHLPVVTVSARAMASDKAEAIVAGANGFLAKPFTAAELLAEIGRQLARKDRKAA